MNQKMQSQQRQINKFTHTQKPMFNPQRKSKISDIYMQQKWYQMHARKIRQITHSSSPQKQRQRQQQQQERYLKRLSMSKKEVQERISNDLRNSNHKMFMKLLDTDNRKEENPEVVYFKNRKKHFNSYYSSKRELERVKMENFTMVTRMMNSSSEVPTLSECKQEFKKVKRFEKKCRKLPSIFIHQQEYRQKFSKRYLLDESQTRSRVNSSRFSHLRLEDNTNIEQKEKDLLSKKLSKEMSKYDLTIGEKTQDNNKSGQKN